MKYNKKQKKKKNNNKEYFDRYLLDTGVFYLFVIFILRKEMSFYFLVFGKQWLFELLLHFVSVFFLQVLNVLLTK